MRSTFSSNLRTVRLPGKAKTVTLAVSGKLVGYE